ncbi:MAG: winged helix-turn-helix domain-containing protein [Phycisphaerales bacterium]
MSTTPQHRRARRLGAATTFQTVRRADGELVSAGGLGNVERLELDAQLPLDEAQRLNPGAELVVETWHKINSRHLAPPEPEDELEDGPGGDELDDRILQAIGVDPMPAAALAEALGIDDGTARGRLQALRDAGLVEPAGNRGWRLA